MILTLFSILYVVFLITCLHERILARIKSIRAYGRHRFPDRYGSSSLNTIAFWMCSGYFSGIRRQFAYANPHRANSPRWQLCACHRGLTPAVHIQYCTVNRTSFRSDVLSVICKEKNALNPDAIWTFSTTAAPARSHRLWPASPPLPRIPGWNLLQWSASAQKLLLRTQLPPAVPSRMFAVIIT